MFAAEAEAIFMAGFNLSMMMDNLEASPDEIKKQQEGTDREVKKLLEEEGKAAGAPAAASQKKNQAKSTGCRGARLSERKEEQKGTEAGVGATS
jgi:hypothetical protein